MDASIVATSRQGVSLIAAEMMASSLRLPINASAVPLARSGNSVAKTQHHASFLYNCRQFSQSCRHNARGAMSQYLPIKSPAQPSQKVRMAKEMTMYKGDLPNDIGLLPGTFIKPLWRDLPSIFENPRLRLRFEWLWLKSGLQNFLRYAGTCQITTISPNVRVS